MRMDKCKKKRRDSDGKLVNVGNFNANGANVNRWTPDNVNDNLGLIFSRSLCLALNGGVFFLDIFYPATKHFTDFLKKFFALNILSLIKSFYVEAKSYHGFDYF